MALSVCDPNAIDLRRRELTKHGTALFPLACYHDKLSETAVPWHWHDEMEFLFVESGTARVSVNGTDYLVKKGEGFFINAGALHAAWPGDEKICGQYSVVCHPRLVGGGVDSILWQKYLEPLLSDPRRPCVHFSNARDWEADASKAIQEAWEMAVSETEGFEFWVRDRLSKVVFLLAKHCPAAEKKPSEKVLRDGARIKVMLQFIQERLELELSLSDIAGCANISENECLRCFRSMIGCSPIQYVKQLRVQKAAELLAATERKISDIGAECGFQEMSYFAKTFREMKGCTPSEFRKNVRASG